MSDQGPKKYLQAMMEMKFTLICVLTDLFYTKGQRLIQSVELVVDFTVDLFLTKALGAEWIFCKLTNCNDLVHSPMTYII